MFNKMLFTQNYAVNKFFLIKNNYAVIVAITVSIFYKIEGPNEFDQTLAFNY